MTQDGLEDMEFSDPQKCFTNAITKGIFEEKQKGTYNSKWVGNWMYMYSKSNIDYFKNKCSRKYIEVPQKEQDA